MPESSLYLAAQIGKWGFYIVIILAISTIGLSIYRKSRKKGIKKVLLFGIITIILVIFIVPLLVYLLTLPAYNLTK